MSTFRTTTHLSEILEESEKQPVVIFKYSSKCGSSARLKEKLERKMADKILSSPVYLVTVQTERVLSNKIAKWFGIKHESPQIFVIGKGKIMYTAHHHAIDTKMI